MTNTKDCNLVKKQLRVTNRIGCCPACHHKTGELKEIKYKKKSVTVCCIVEKRIQRYNYENRTK